MAICLLHMELTAGLRPSDWKGELDSQNTDSN